MHIIILQVQAGKAEPGRPMTWKPHVVANEQERQSLWYYVKTMILSSFKGPPHRNEIYVFFKKQKQNRAGNHCHSATIRHKFTQKTTRLGQGPCSQFKNAVACSYAHTKCVAIVVTQKICGHCSQKMLWEMYTENLWSVTHTKNAVAITVHTANLWL